MPLREDQIRRYARHVLLPDVGGVGQSRLLDAAIRVDVGPGRDAEVAALVYLAAAGVGTLVLGGDADGAVTAGEIAGGIAYGAADTGRSRREAIAARIAAINPDVRVVAGADSPGAEPLVVPGGPGDLADALLRGGAAATAAIHRLATRSPDPR